MSHLNEHKFGHGLEDCINPPCSCSLEVESNLLSLLRCHPYTIIRNKIMNDLNSNGIDTLSLNENSLLQLLFHRGPQYDIRKNVP